MTYPGEISNVIVPRSRDLGDGFTVRRVLPHMERRMVGSFIFLDQMGPVVLRAGQGLDVRPHPHIGLATVTYLFEGSILHRDSLGYVQPIHPGDVNWMTAGRGIVHSERSAPEERGHERPVYGIQSWVALPRGREESEPSFVHHKQSTLPLVEAEGVRLRLIAGSLFGATSPVAALSDLFYADVRMEPGARLALPRLEEERGVYIVEGALDCAGQLFEAGSLVVFKEKADALIAAARASRVMLLGGAAADGPRHIWWNFVSSSKDRIEQAKADWKAGRFAPVPEESEFIPLPE